MPALAPALALTLALLLPAAGPAHALTPAQAAERAQLMHDGEAALRQGRADDAVPRFERAVALDHRADAEIALVRALMQAGESAQAMTYAAHAAGAHREVPEGALLYARLLVLGARPEAARRLLDEAAQRFPGDAGIAAMRAQPADSLAQPEAVAVRLRPFGSGAALPRDVRWIGNGTLLGAAADRVLVPLAALGASSGPAQRLWVRDGRGRSVAARLLRRLPGLGLALLALDAPLPVRARARALGDTPAAQALPEPVERDPFPGRPVYAVLFAPEPEHGAEHGGTEPAWPRLQPGFLGTAATPEDLPALGVGIDAAAPGGPLLDARGRWVGVSVPGPAGQAPRRVPMSRLRAALGPALLPLAPAPAAPDPATAPATLAVEALHELGLRQAVQVLAGGRGTATPCRNRTSPAGPDCRQ